jgi:predicted nucleic acid-binding protein
MSVDRLLVSAAPLVLDSGAVIAYLARNVAVRTRCLALVEAGYPVLLPTVVYAQVERGGHTPLTTRYLNELLSLATPIPLSMVIARQAGWLLRDSGTTDVVDAVVVAEAIAQEIATILTSDRGDINYLLGFTANQQRRGVRVVGV